jgi:hypothetical protein
MSEIPIYSDTDDIGEVVVDGGGEELAEDGEPSV